MLVLQAKGITKRYGGFTALKDVALTLERGMIRGLIGPNGAGKSTLIDVLSGRGHRNIGSVNLNGAEISGLSAQARRRLGMARSFQRINVFPDMTIGKQLLVAARLATDHGLDEVVSALELEPHLDTTAKEASYGCQRRLDLALALVGRPSVLLLDEPSAGLTAEESLVLARILVRLAKQLHVSVLIVEHDMEVIFSICDQLTVLHLGNVLAEGPPEHVRKNQRVVAAYLGSAA